jgi:hypothetical protein
VLDQTHYNRPQAKDDTMTAEVKKNRPIDEKESNRWLTTMENACRNIPGPSAEERSDEGSPPDEIKVINICDREGDMYELFDKAEQNNRLFLIRIAQNRMTVENGRILDEIQEKPCSGRINTVIPRDSRRNLKERELVLQVRYAPFEVKKPQIKNVNRELLPSINVNVIYVKEENPHKDIEPIEWFLMTNEPVDSGEEAYEKVSYYIQRWKMAQLRSACAFILY